MPPGTRLCIKVTDHDIRLRDLLYLRHDQVPQFVLKRSFDNHGDVSFQQVQSYLEENIINPPVRVFRKLVMLHVEGIDIAFLDLISAKFWQIEPATQLAGKGSLA